MFRTEASLNKVSPDEYDKRASHGKGHFTTPLLPNKTMSVFVPLHGAWLAFVLRAENMTAVFENIRQRDNPTPHPLWWKSPEAAGAFCLGRAITHSINFWASKQSCVWCSGKTIALILRGWLMMKHAHDEILLQNWIPSVGCRVGTVTDSMTTTNWGTNGRMVAIRHCGGKNSKCCQLVLMTPIWILFLHSLAQKSRNYGWISVSGWTESCHFDAFQCSQWRKFSQIFLFQCSSGRCYLICHATLDRTFINTYSYWASLYSSILILCDNIECVNKCDKCH